MKLYTYQVTTCIGPFERIGAELNGKLVDLNLACTAYLEKTKDPNPYASASFHIPPHMVKFFEGGGKVQKDGPGNLGFCPSEDAKRREDRRAKW